MSHTHTSGERGRSNQALPFALLFALTGVVLGVAVYHECGAASTAQVAAQADRGMDTEPLDEAVAGLDAAAPGPAIDFTSPADGEAGVSILIQPLISFDEDIDLDSVDPDSLVLRDESGISVQGRVQAGVDGRSLAFEPRTPLRYGETYYLEIGPVRSVDGEPSEAATFAFATSANPLVYSFDQANGYITAYRRYALTDSGQLVEILEFGGAGDDGMWLSDDDVISWRSTFRYRGDIPVFAAHYSGPGGDGQWSTGDDLVQEYEAQEVEDGRGTAHWRYAGPGSDGLWLNADDRVISVALISYKLSGDVERIGLLDNPGGDGDWLTDDDHVATETVHEYDADGRLVRISTYSGPGMDGDWGTSDDLIEAIRVLTYDGASGPTRITRYLHAGGDGRWLTSDDFVSDYTELEYTGTGQLSRRVVYTEPGSDGAWFTEDDAIFYYTDFEYDQQGVATRTTLYSHPGEDLVWFSADDRVSGYNVTDLDLRGNRILRRAAIWPGLDDVWLSADDLLSAELRFDPTR